MKTIIKKLLMIFIVMLSIVLVGCEEFFFPIDENENPYDDLPISGYYAGAENLEGEELKDFLTELVNTGFIGVDYGDAKTALAEADVDPNDSTKVLTIYSRDSVNREWDGSSWHREHVWPNSRLGLERVEENDVSQASDLHNLRAIVPSVNSSRSNKIYDTITGADTFYPGDKDKGDVARILLYMTIKYPFLTLVDEVLDNDPDTNYTPQGAKMAKLSMILKWHTEDPVDDFERNRNEVIYRWQKNRNPFIDHPEFVAKIWD